MTSYISCNPQFIVNGFLRAGITGALDAYCNGDQPGEGTGDIEESGHAKRDESEEEETTDDEDA